MGKPFVEKVKRLFTRAGDFVRDIPDFLAMRRKEAQLEKRRMEARKKRLSPEEYQAYRNKILLKKFKKAAAVVACVLVVFLAVWGVVRLTRTAIGRFRESKEPEEEENPVVYEEKDITVGSTGCMLLHSPFLNTYADSAGNYDFGEIYRYITPVYSAPDLMTCEFEGCLAGEDYSGYPVFRSPDAIIEDIRDSGVDLQLLATNHIYDGGAEAFQRTLQVYEEKGIAYTGARESTSDKPYYIADVNGVTLGFMDYAYETEGEDVSLNGIPLSKEDENRVNTFDYDYLDSFYNEINKNIQDMKAEGVRFIIADLHWGEEYELQENETQREIAQTLCNLGVNALIGGHTHCEQPIDVFTGRNGEKMFCIFSVGNALSNQRAELIEEMPEGHTEDGVIVELTLHQDTAGTVSITGVDLIPTWVYRYIDDATRYYILPLNDVENIEETTGISGIHDLALASYQRTMDELGGGLKKAQEAFTQEAPAA